MEALASHLYRFFASLFIHIKNLSDSGQAGMTEKVYFEKTINCRLLTYFHFLSFLILGQPQGIAPTLL
jgi:hypothetical protein